MTNSKATKKALFMSMLSLLLCFTMLMGATFAWFTDTVKSTNNIIKSGTLEVGMYWADGTEAVPADGSTDWEDASAEAIFNYDNWEPGYTEVRHIKIANEGTLALKYQLRIVPTGEVSDLADVIDVYYFDGAQQIDNRTQLTDANKLGILSDVLGTFSDNAQGNLYAKAEDGDILHTITIALKMQESAGNYYQNMNIGSDFAVELYATQLTAEEDSFDDQYDKNATYEKTDGGYVAFSKKGLSDIAALASTDTSITSVNYNGEDVPVVRDVDGMSEAIEDGEETVVMTSGNYKMPSSGTTGSVDFVGTKDTVVDVTMGAYLDGATVSFTGLTIKTSTGMANGNGSDYAALYTPNVTYTDCTFVGPMRVGRDGAKFINCTFTGLGNDYVWTYGNDVTFENCTFNTDGKAILIYNEGTGANDVVVEGCTFNASAGAKAGAIANQNCAAIEIDNYQSAGVGAAHKLTAEGNTFGANFSGVWRIKNFVAGNAITVNGVAYTQIAVDGKLMTIDASNNVTVL